jgi:hypothetical protein
MAETVRAPGHGKLPVLARKALGLAYRTASTTLLL